MRITKWLQSWVFFYRHFQGIFIVAKGVIDALPDNAS